MLNGKEATFTASVAEFVNGVLNDWRTSKVRDPDTGRLALNGLVVRQKAPVLIGRIPVWVPEQEWDGQNWTWKAFPREVDVVLGREATVDGYRQILPLVAIENKTDGWLQTPEIGSKNATYAALSEQYPCVLTCLILESNKIRRMAATTLLRHGRHFNLVLTGWTDTEKSMLAQGVSRHLDYAVAYWGR